MEENQKSSPRQAGTGVPVEVPATALPAPPRRGLSTAQKIGIGFGILAIVVAVSALFFGLMTHPYFTAVLRDVAIIVLAVVTIITTLLLAVLLFQLQSLMVLLRDEVQPILRSINETTGTVRGTTTFVSDAVVSPVIQVAGYASGVRQAFRTAFRGSDGRGKTRPSAQDIGAKNAELASMEAGTKDSPG